MLSAEERRRLDEIERLLQVDDPRFVARMRTRRPQRSKRWVLVVSYCLLWMVALVAGVFVGPIAGLCVAAVGAVTGAVILGVAAYRRRRRRFYGWIPPGW
jgi:uncharacterized membrane-anchored protein